MVVSGCWVGLTSLIFPSSIPLSLLSLPSINLDNSSKESISLDAFAWPLPHILSRVLSVIYRGLDRRVKLMVPFFQVSRIEVGAVLLLTAAP